MARNIIGNDKFIEIFIKVSIEECISRDPKGLYKKALNGEIDNFIGIAESNPYEAPINPEIIVDSLSYSINDSVHIIMNYLSKNIFVKQSA